MNRKDVAIHQTLHTGAVDHCRKPSGAARSSAIAGCLVLALMLSAVPGLCQSLVLDEIASGLGSMTYVTHAGDNSGRLFVTTQLGEILIHDGAQILAAPFLDITARVGCCGERGLLSVAFHPEYESNGHFFVYYTALPLGDTQVSRFTVSAGDPNLADAGSEVFILNIAQPAPNHNGGQLQFGPDGYLYIATGDGGAGGAPAQDLGTLLGKLLRIDIDGALPYTIPPSNPFVGIAGDDEIWAYGLRNPWRFSFDRVTGDLFIADVGQFDWEEINFQPATSPGCENYGWPQMEGNECFNPPVNCQPGPPNGCNPSGALTLPVHVYGHIGGNCSITGGYRYRGRAIPELEGVFVFGDNCSGRIWGAILDAQGTSTVVTELLDTNAFINTFGEDEEGELYIGTLGGRMFRVTPPLRISPPSGTYGSTQTFDFLLSVYETAAPIVALSLTIDQGTPITNPPPCAVIGSLPNGGTTLRCPLPPGFLAAGTHVLSVTIELGNGQILDRSVTWTIESVTE